MLTISEEKMEEIRDQIERLNRLPENDDFGLVLTKYAQLDRVMKRWRRWHLKKNQPGNYVRFTETRFKEIPSGAFDIWKVQMWGRKKLIEEYRISLGLHLEAMKEYNLEMKEQCDGYWECTYKPHVQ